MDSPRAIADETTGILSQGSSQGYQALSAAAHRSEENEEEYYTTTRRSRKLKNANASSGAKPETGGSEPLARRRRKQEDHGHDDNNNNNNNNDDDDDDDDDDDGESDTDTANDSGPPWWKQFVSKFQSIELENKGSVARDHLALERTFLAWLRTSLAFASIGVAVTQLFRLDTSSTDSQPRTGADKNQLRRMGRPLGTAFLAISIVTLLLGCNRYYRAQEWILKGKFPASRGTILVMAFIAVALMILSLVVVVAIHPSL